ncbi:MAG: hypothetical protein AB4050_17190 [Synechococcus sp.]
MQLTRAIKNSRHYLDGYLPISQCRGIYPGRERDSSDGIQQAVALAREKHLAVLLDVPLLYTHKPIAWWGRSTREPSDKQGRNPWNTNTVAIVGSRELDSVPEIRLIDGARGFGDANNPRPVLQVAHYAVIRWDDRYPDGNAPVDGVPWNHPFGAPRGTRRNASLIFNVDLRGFKITTGRNPGAFGIGMAAAQGAMLTNLEIDARGGYGGFAGIPGRNYGGYGLRVVGGRHAVVVGPEAGVGGAGETLIGCEFINQSGEVVRHKGLAPLNLIGCKIVKQSGSILKVDGRKATGYNILSMVHCQVEITDEDRHPPIDNSPNKTLYIQDCWVKGGSVLVKNGSRPVTLEAGKWNHLKLVVNTDPRQSGEDVFTTHAIVDSQQSEIEARQDIAVGGEPPCNLRSRHRLPLGVLQFEAGGKTKVVRFTDERVGGDPGNTPQQNTAAIQKAFQIALEEGHGNVFFPLFGRDNESHEPYRFAETIDMPKGTRMFGATFGYGACIELVLSDRPNRFIPAIRTHKSKDADNYLGTLSVKTPSQFDYGCGFVHWRGRGSQYILRTRQHYEREPQGVNHSFRNQLFTDFACGLFFGQGNDTHIDWVGTPSPRQGNDNLSVLIDRCDGVNLYCHNYEGGKKDRVRYVDCLVRNSRNVAIWGGIKREATTGILAFVNCDNVMVTSFGAMRELPRAGLIYLMNSRNVRLGPANVQTLIHGTEVGRELLTIRTEGQKVLGIPYPEGFSYLENGSIDLDALVVDYGTGNCL